MSDGAAPVVVVGGGIIGTAVAAELLRLYRTPVLLLEAEREIAVHQSGHNSGVIHAGLYYKPGSLKARTCAAGREALYAFCESTGIPYRRCGKLVVATREAELPALTELERRGEANGLRNLRRLCVEEMLEIEPEVRGVAGLWVEETGVVDFRLVARAYARQVLERGGEIRLGVRVTGVVEDSSGLRLRTPEGEVAASHLINCAGLASDRLARLAGVEPGVAILPFRGDYFELRPERRQLVRGLIYPVPDPALPFLDVHLTRTIGDHVEAGPNAVPALARDRYERFAFRPRDAWDLLAYPGTWRLFRRYWKTGAQEIVRSTSRTLFARACARLVPAISAADLIPAGCGIRAQAVDRQGRMVDDFHLRAGRRSLHVLNAPSPGATASLAIGAHVATEAGKLFALS